MDRQQPVTGSQEAETESFQPVLLPTRPLNSMGTSSKLLPRQILPKVEPGSSSSSPILDARLAGGEPPAKRRCVSSACMPCRKRKSKCDGAQPTCAACATVYNSECVYDLDADHRRKGALKRDIAELTTKNNVMISIVDAIRKRSDADVDDIVHLIRSNSDVDLEGISKAIENMGPTRQEQAIEPPSSLEGELVVALGRNATSDKTSRSRYYGHTSNLWLQSPEDDRLQVRMPVDQVGAWTNVTSDVDLINHLLNAYFAWSHPWYLLFSEETFFHGMRGKESKYCTPLLMNAVLALGCNYSDRPEARADPNDPSTVGAHFFAEAKRLLAEDDDRSSLTIIQALGVMSLYKAMNDHDSGGRRYVAQMMSMVVELGLHTSYAAQPSSILSATEIEARRITFWGCFVLETAWAICVGRISTLPRYAIRLEKPFLEPHLERKTWKPIGIPEASSAGLEQPSYKYSILLQCSILSEIVDDIIHSFYAPRDRVTSRKLQLYHDRLMKWHANLPEPLKIRETRIILPQVLTLHAYYHNCVIQLFRPFLKVAFVQNSKTPREFCTESAKEISKLLGIYSHTYGLERSFFINSQGLMSAAIIHLVDICSPHPTAGKPHEIETCLADAIRGLSDISKSMPIVGRFVKLICVLISKWCKVIPAQVQEVMNAIQVNSPTSTTVAPSPPNQLDITNGMNSTIKLDPNGGRKQSVPELLGMAPSNQPENGSSNTQQQLFWNPFPNTFEGVPLVMPQETNNMDIINVLDSGVDGDWPQWNRDGFTVPDDGTGQLWGVNWD